MTTPQRRDLTAEQREELRCVYVSVPALHHLTFDEALADRSILICLWNLAKARRKTRARLAAAAEYFDLRSPPCSR